MLFLCGVNKLKGPLIDKSLDFSTQIVFFYEEYSKARKDITLAKKLLRSATSVGANINEAIYGNSKADFVSKLYISLKETGESIYCLTLLKRTNLIDYNYDLLLSLAEEIKRMLISSIKTAKATKNDITLPLISAFILLCIKLKWRKGFG